MDRRWMYRCSRACAALVLALAAQAAQAAAEPQVVSNDEHHLTTIAPGVYTIRHKRAGEIGALAGNTTLIVGEREALVVDSTSAPSFARRDLEVFRQWTDKPIRWLVNTHWHGDHTYGNSAYAEQVPGIAIVAHRETPRLMQGYLTYFIGQNKKLPEVVGRILETGKTETGSELTKEELDEMRALQEVVEEWILVRVARGLDIPSLGGRRIRVRKPGGCRPGNP
jgi:hypothetical protein